ncbi:hypothetical protein MW887_008725 [Aspergillus wentii]|nr:hypothetical protein MW887_008725 [Aspergillus wentii]
MESHNITVASIAARVHQFWKSKEPFRIYHGSTNSTRQSQHAHHNTVSTASLTNVLHIDRDAKTALVEPNVPMDQLVRATTQSGLVPLVVMEFPGITVGGGFSGTSGESSSFRHGFFDATVNWVEIVLPDGEIVTASKDSHPDLFWGAASAFGTLGVVTLVEVQLREAKPYVELAYHSLSNMEEALQTVRDATKDSSIEYLDGIVYARDHIIICAGRLTDTLPENTQPQQFTRSWDQWFYLHAQRTTKYNTKTKIDYIPLEDYLFRYDRGGFWVGRYAYRYFLTPFNRITRYLLDTFMHTRVMYHALHESGHSKQYIIQDVAVPHAGATEFIDWLDEKENFGAYPIWLCPLRHSPGLMARGTASFDKTDGKDVSSTGTEDDEYLMNFGLWAPSYANNVTEFIAKNRQLEGKVHSLHGKKWLYAHAYYTEDEFWSIYDKKKYDALREKYHASHLPSLFEKVRVDLRPQAQNNQELGWIGWAKNTVWDTWPVSGLYGVYKAWRGGEYLIKK